MKPTDEQHQGASQDTEGFPNVTINHIPDEVLLEIFDSYRQNIDIFAYNRWWRKNPVWIVLAQVCSKWRAVMFASASRLDLGITVGPDTPGHIKTILSGPLPIFIDYRWMYTGVTGSALWRMRASLGHHDRVREISFSGMSADFDKLFKVTNCAFPLLESLDLCFGDKYKQRIPDTFLRGPDLSDLPLRRLRLMDTSLSSISRFLLSATALTDLTLLIDTAFSLSSKMSLLACLQGMPSLRRLDLDLSISSESSSQPSTNKDIVSLSKLTRFRYRGDGLVLDALVAGLSAPSLRDIHVLFFNEIWPPTVHLTRFIDDIQEHYHAIHVNFVGSISLLTQSECIGRRAPRFNLFPAPTKAPNYSHFPAILQMSGVISTRFTTVEELRVTITSDEVDTKIFWENLILWLQQFPRVKTLRTKCANNYSMARALLQDHEGAEGYLPLLPALEEIELKKDRFESRHRPDAQLAAFKPFAYARQQAGRPVKIFFGQYASL